MIPASIESLKALNALIEEAQYIKKVAKQTADRLNGYDDAKVKILTKKITDVDYQTLNRNTGKLITPDKIDNYDRDDLKENIVVIQ